MSSNINLSAIDHPEMTPNENRFSSCLLALCTKALASANINLDKINFHKKLI